MIKNRKRLSAKILISCLGIIMFIGTIALGTSSNYLKILPTSQANSIDTLNLNLSDQQKVTIQSILRDANEQIKQVKANTQINRSPFARRQSQQQAQELFRQIEAIRSNALDKIRNQMNSSQQETFDELVSNAKEKKQQRADMLRSLDLTKQQKMDIIPHLEKTKSQIWDILGNPNLSKDQKIEQIRNTRQAAVNTIREQLTPDQQAKFDVWQQQQSPIF